MSQGILSLLPDGATTINEVISVAQGDEKWIYYCGFNPVFCHEVGDDESFHMFVSQLVVEGMCKQVEIVKAFGVSKESVKRWVKLYRQEGVKGFYKKRGKRRGAVLKAEEIKRAEELFRGGEKRSAVAAALGVKKDTLRKAIKAGRIREEKGATVEVGEARQEEPIGQTKTERGEVDVAASAEMGMGCTRPVERMLVAVGRLAGGAPTRFERCVDVPFGGVLCSLPALMANGLLRHAESCFAPLKGYYQVVHVLILLAYMALGRIRTAERLRYEAPGELGKLMGLDRIPEVRTLRDKLAIMSMGETPEKWSGLLSAEWLKEARETVGVLYVDGHVRVYHGELTKLPKRYVSRQRLCLRGTTDYWVNDALGQPYFVVTQAIDEGLIKTLEAEVIPRLLKEVPKQPSEAELEADPSLHRFILVFDRAGYSPRWFKKIWKQHRIACITYRKQSGEAWPKERFKEEEVAMPNGEKVTMKLAEMGSWIGGAKDGLWMREVRRLTTSGHQTSLISTAYRRFALQDAASMFTRWCQENFFRYMMEQFGIDLLGEYGTAPISALKKVVNPRWREVDARCRSELAKLHRYRAQFAVLELHPELLPEKMETWERKKGELRENIVSLEVALAQLKEQRKGIKKHIAFSELLEAERFEQLAPSRKQLLDTVKMIAYRAETAMASLLRPLLGRPDDARALLRDLYRSEADLLPDEERQELVVRIHPMTNPQAQRAIQSLLTELNTAEFVYPGTTMKMVYQMVGDTAA